MRLRVLSDLHLEHFDEGRELPDVPADAVVLAGDIHRHAEGLSWAAERFAGLPILYVPGNHEFYGTSMPLLRQAMAYEAERLGIELLDNRSLTLDGVRFHGTTLWTDFALYDGEPEHDPELTEQKALWMMPDFSIIEQPEGQTFSPAESRRLHAESLSWLEAELTRPFDGPRVVISHHAPLAECIPPRYRGDALSPAFASHLPSLMGRMELWIHGHVHEPVDRVLGGTRILANPGGYPDEFEPPLFVNDLVVEI
ncbi:MULTISPECIES: metallophosphoesterase [Halomonadaceae]|uniref:Metallo-dependent phosphatase n=1 Tax=Billgrantia aerodenitrificans TaxID=2733483 RepID=A0ABS9AXY7_9GAMM|nr:MULTISPECIES: metallophosphoesterase [Halomonas]MCE8026574.1 metallo-dependent phosphatase [Halomonas aerodenitrificans]MCE8038610.1 metallo-dependent phosphatase [Halomonas sp. MCCC 1A11062]